MDLPEFINNHLLESHKGAVVLIKYGGNAMVDKPSQKQVLHQIAQLKYAGIYPVVVHGGGPVIKSMLEASGIQSEFVDGHRVTEKDSMEVVELALSGRVNGILVNELNRLHVNAVGLSGKDGGMVRAKKRLHRRTTQSGTEKVDLGFVGDVDVVDVKLIRLLIENGYLPVISPVSTGDDGEDYNINADMFAGHLAGALKADAFVAITNVDGLMKDPEKPESQIKHISPDKVEELFGSVIQGGMIPKIEACLIALENDVKAAHIVNGSTENAILLQLLTEDKSGTVIS